MYIDALELEGFRNYRESRALFSRGINVITGGNAQGKTNMLEAIFLLCTGRSFRARSDRELIGFDRESARVSARGESGGRERRLEITMRRGGRRTMTSNSVRLKTSGELAGIFSAVLFSPEDLELIRGGASLRRRFMDLCISQLKPAYAGALQEFAKALEGKTRILRDSGEKPSLLSLLPEYDAAIARMSALLIHYRAAFIRRLAPAAERIHGEFSGGEKLTVGYKTVSTIDDPLRPAAELLPMILEHLESHRAAEAASGMCLTGAHKDDLDIKIDGSAARTFASQGQVRTAALSMKLAEREIHEASRGEPPILLLDDVLSELDGGRQDFILNRIGGGQVFITCCEDERIACRTGGRVLRISGGAVAGEE